jgi:hypothetical protein
VPTSTLCFRAHSPIIDLAVLKNETIIFSTKNSGIRVVDQEDYTVLSNILPQELNHVSMTVFSPDAKLVALVKGTQILVMVLKTQKILKTINIPNETIQTLHFNDSSHYLIVGTSEGRVLQYRYNSNTQLSRLCSFPHLLIDEKPQKVKNNYVSAISSYKNRIACSGYGGAIVVLNFHTRSDKLVINRSRERIEALCFIDENKLISGNVDGVLEVIDLQNPKQIRRLNAPFTKIKHIMAMPNREYILVASDKNFISLINIKTLKVIDNKYLEFDEKIQKIVKKDETSLFVVLRDKSVHIVELLHLGSLRKLIQSNKLYQAYRLLIKAPMLRGSHEERELEERYQEIKEQTITYLLEDNLFAAQELVKNLRTIPSKKDEIALLFTAFNHYEKFQLMFHQQKLNVAYSMCDKYPALKYTPEHKSMEKQWHKVFKKAEKEMLLNNIDSARVLLNEYMLVTSKRTLIQFILYKNREFLEFLQAIKKKEFQQLTDLAKEHHTFTAFEHYQILNQETENDFLEAQRLIILGNTHLAQLIIDKVEENPKYESIAKNLQSQCDDVQQLYHYYNEDKLKKCYTLLDKTRFLKTTDLGSYLEEKWEYLIQECEIFALKGQVKKLETALGKLKKLPSRSDRVGDLLRLAYQKKILYFLQQKGFQKALVDINTYTNLFGLDTEMSAIIKKYVAVSKSKINLTAQQAQRKPRDYWLFA